MPRRSRQRGAVRCGAAALVAVAVLCPLAARLAADPAGTVSGAAAEPPPSGILSITLDQAVPFVARDVPRGNQDLVLDMVLRDGRPDPDAWAWLNFAPAIEHRAKVLDATPTDAGLQLEIEVVLRPVPPKYLGGTGRIQVDLKRDGHVYAGQYRAEFQGTSDREGLDLWRRLGGRGQALWLGSVRSGRTESITQLPTRRWGGGGTEGQPILAHGRLRPLAATAPPIAGHPRLFLRKADLPALKAKVQTEPARRFLEATRAALEAGATGNAVPRPPVACDGFAAAGWAFLFALSGEQNLADRAAEAARRALVPTAAPKNAPAGSAARDATMAESRRLAGLAAAYDFAGDAWPKALRAEVRDHLARQAARLAALELPPSLEDVALGPGGRFGDPAGPFDCRLATVRAAAGLAALAVLHDPAAEGDPAGPPTPEAALAVAARSVRRFLESGIGEHGSGLGQYGFDAAVEIVYPFIQTYRGATGDDLAAGTGAPYMAAWGMMTWGHGFAGREHPACGGWLAAGLAALPAAWRPAARWYMDTCGYVPANPWDGMLAAVNDPADVPPAGPGAPGSPLRLAMADRAAGSVALRSGWDRARDFVTLFDYAAGATEAAGRRGQFSVYGLGRRWIGRVGAAPGDFGWPAVRDGSGMQVHDSLVNFSRAAVPTEPGLLGRLRVGRDGTGSASMTARGFREVGPPSPNAESLDDALAWVTVGADYTGTSGARAVVAIVAGNMGLGQRQRVWEMDVGSVPAERVKTDGLSFLLSPPDSRASLAGTMVFPPTGSVEYQPPGGGRGGRLRCHLVKPGPNVREMLERSMADRTLGTDRVLAGEDENGHQEKDVDLDVAFLVDEKDRARRERLQQEGKIIFNKLYKYTSSNKMGAPDRYPRAAGAFVLVLTIQEGPPPPVEVLAKDDAGLVRVGRETVRYQEYLVTFEGGR